MLQVHSPPQDGAGGSPQEGQGMASGGCRRMEGAGLLQASGAAALGMLGAVPRAGPHDTEHLNDTSPKAPSGGGGTAVSLPPVPALVTLSGARGTLRAPVPDATSQSKRLRLTTGPGGIKRLPTGSG